MVTRLPRCGGTPNSFGDERGAGEILMIIMMSAMLAMAGLVFDSGMAFNAAREANNIASNAARVGANAIDTDRLYNEGSAWIDHERANGAASNAAYGSGAETAVTTLDYDKGELTVKVTMTHNTVLLGIVGFDSFQMEGEGTARIQKGPGS